MKYIVVIGWVFWFLFVLFIVMPFMIPVVLVQAKKAEWGHRVKNG